MPAYRPIPASLTQPVPEPPKPPLLCMLNKQAVPCVLDTLATIPAWRAALNICNADRQRVDLIGRTGVLYAQ